MDKPEEADKVKEMKTPHPTDTQKAYYIDNTGCSWAKGKMRDLPGGRRVMWEYVEDPDESALAWVKQGGRVDIVLDVDGNPGHLSRAAYEGAGFIRSLEQRLGVPTWPDWQENSTKRPVRPGQVDWTSDTPQANWRLSAALGVYKDVRSGNIEAHQAVRLLGLLDMSHVASVPKPPDGFVIVPDDLRDVIYGNGCIWYNKVTGEWHPVRAASGNIYAAPSDHFDRLRQT